MSTAETPAERRERYIRTLARRDLWEVLGVPAGAAATAVTTAADRRRSDLRSRPMPQDRRKEELAWCDHAERVLTDPRLRRAWEQARAGARVGPVESRSETRARTEREARMARSAATRPPMLDIYLSASAGSPGLLAGAGPSGALRAATAEARGEDDALRCIDRALELRQRGDAAAALGWARRAVEITPTAHALNVLGTIEREAGDLTGSERSLRASLTTEPNPLRNAAGHVALASTLRAVGRPEEARQTAEIVLESDDEDRHAWRALAGALADEGRADEAVGAIRRSLPLDTAGAVEIVRVLRTQRIAAGDRRGVAIAEDALRHLAE